MTTRCPEYLLKEFKRHAVSTVFPLTYSSFVSCRQRAESRSLSFKNFISFEEVEVVFVTLKRRICSRLRVEVF